MIHMLYIKVSEQSEETLTKSLILYWVLVFSAIFINQTKLLHYNMVSGKHKSRSMRRVFRRTPGGDTVKVYKKRKPSKAKCAGCGKVLIGVPRERPYKMQNMPKTAKRPERPYGGVLCSACSRKKIIEKIKK